MNIYYDDFKVRYSNVDVDGNASYLTICDFSDDVGIAHGDVLGMGLSYMQTQKKSWFQHKSITYLKHTIPYNLSIRGETFITKMGVIKTEREFRFFDGDGNDLCYKRTGLVHVDLQTRQILGCDANMIANCPQALSVFALPFKKITSIALPNNYMPKYHEVSKIFIDPNNHVNNSYYGMWALLDVSADIEKDYRCLIVDIDYLKELKVGDKFFVYSQKETDDPYDYDEKSNSNLVFKHAIYNQDNELISLARSVWIIKED